MRSSKIISWLALFLASPIFATDVKIFQTQSQAALLAGTLDSVSVDPLGRLQLADRTERLVAPKESLLLSAVSVRDGWVVGTGSSGRILHIDRRGEVSVLFTAPEPEIFALWADADGTLFAGSSPHGKVYRITRQGAEPFFTPGETYIWALARRADGALLVATGTDGKLFQVDRQGQGRLLHRSRDPNLRALQPLPDGSVLVGTAGESMILSLSPRGEVRTLYASPSWEVVALAAAPDGTCYAAVAASEARSGEAAVAPLSAATAATVSPPAAVTPKTPGETALPPTFNPSPFAVSTPAQSLVLRLSPGRQVETVWEFASETVYSLLWQGDRLWVGTGPQGHLYSFRPGAASPPGGMVLEKDTDERQVTALLADQPGPAFLTNNAAALFRFNAGTERQGSYTSAPFDAQEMSSFGSFRWRGELSPGAKLRFSFRTGISSVPDDTWSPWTEPRSGREVPLADLPAGRYLQWLALFEAAAGPLRLDGVEISYRQQNVRPSIKSFTVLAPGQVLASPSFNPIDQIFEPTHPNRDSIFTTLKLTSADPQAALLKQLWKKGYRTLRWTADDPNRDQLRYDLYFTSDGLNGQWLPMASSLKEDYLSFDATVLPDGVYRFRLIVSDATDNSPAEALTDEEMSDAVIIDNSPPALVSAERRGKTVELQVDDHWSPLRDVAYSFDAGEWKPLAATDGMLDSSSERFLVETPDGARLLLVRVMDIGFNLVTFDLSAAGPAVAQARRETRKEAEREAGRGVPQPVVRSGSGGPDR